MNGICDRCEEHGTGLVSVTEPRRGETLLVHPRFCEIPGDVRI